MRHTLNSIINSIILVTMTWCYAGSGHADTVTSPTKVIKRDVLGNPGNATVDVDEYVLLNQALSPEGFFHMQTYRSADGTIESLQFYFEVEDDSTEADNDEIRVRLDFDHSHTDTDQDRAIIVTRQLTTGDGSDNVYTSSMEPLSAGTPITTIPNTEWEITNNPSSWIAEFRVTAEQLDRSYIPSSFGMHVNVIRGSESQANFPAISSSAISDWVNIQTRKNIEYAISLDYSGSMAATDGESETRWERAKRATDLFVATLSLFKDQHGLIEDRVSLSQYSWPCGADANNDDSATTGDVSGITNSHLMALIPEPLDNGDSPFTAGNSDNPPGGNCTPIQNGVDFALDQLDFPNDEKDRIIMLLSDGLHNRPSNTSSDFKLNPENYFTANEKDAVGLRTVAMLPDGTGGTDTLAALSNAFSSFSVNAQYQQVDLFQDLLNAFIETLTEPLTINQVPLVGGNYEPGAPDKLVFIAVWNNPGSAVPISINIGATDVTGDGQSFHNTQLGYATVVFDNPTENATWTLNAMGADNEFVLADLRILSRFLVEQRPYYAGDSILLQVSLRDNGKPILGADVTAEIAKPGEGLGDYLSTVQENCEPGVPQIPTVPDRDKPGFQVGMLSQTHMILAPTTTTSTSTGAATTGQTGDPVTGRHALAASHFERCNKQGLDRDDLPGVQFHDDGTHGDLIPGDGVYSLNYLLDNEGSYNIRYFALGQTTDGVKFSRTRRISQYAGIRPDPAATVTQTQNLGVSSGMINHAVYFLPKDAVGNYMGPGFNTSFKVTTSSGMLVGGVVDLNNGYYGQLIRYPQGSPEPTVTITTTDGCFEKTVGDKGTKPPVSKLVWFLWLAILVLFILWILCLLRRKS